MTDPWLPPTPRPAPPVQNYPHPAYPYGRPGFGYGPPAPTSGRHTGLIVGVVAGALFLVTVCVVLAAVVGTAVGRGLGDGAGSRAGEGVVQIYGRSGTAIPITLPPGFQLSNESDLRDGYLAAGARGGDYPPYLDIIADGDALTQRPDLVRLATAIQAENNRRDGATTTTSLSYSTINGRAVAQWEESYPETDEFDAYRQLNAVAYVGDQRDHLHLSYADDAASYSAPAAKRALTSVLTSLPTK